MFGVNPASRHTLTTARWSMGDSSREKVMKGALARSCSLTLFVFLAGSHSLPRGMTTMKRWV